ncbi:periplasmic beta-glucosidase precursor [Penicillium macrosclerotiorum]|uniref:periplasmic beta-glucosidase precursor n=1 Tax=Penicillium macrosclerotiorum TaxID=303699 RepID=UPI0025473B64|nr:periplasmic beta-glucosidase precursor [Penicillium macrosclerotiorum]KAJ5689680.1 periplasmic beta-glucosidase precursor [Penicillium macrosclerotiorum]
MEDQFQGIRLGFEETSAEAARLAESCEAAIVVVGRDREWETEGQDILSFDLPGEQVRLIRAVAAVCPRTIVLVQAGTPVNMEPWMHEVSAILYTWYQGQELGNAAAAVLLGRPLFPLGFGLSYNSFTVSPGSINTHELIKDLSTPLTITAHVTNTGGSKIPGQETVVAWFSQSDSTRLQRPKKQICGFAKSRPLLPSETNDVEIVIDFYAFGMFETKRNIWIIDANAEFEILLGTTAANAVPVWKVRVPREITWIK